VDLTGQPLFPFGFGLSYTTFEYSGLTIDPAEIGSTSTATIRFALRNSGTRAGAEVVQLYVRDILATVARPVMELKKFRRVTLAAGQRQEITFELNAQELRMLDRDLRWVVEPGAFRIMIGASSKDIRLRGQFTVR
jgi:beta-glucosidase